MHARARQLNKNRAKVLVALAVMAIFAVALGLNFSAHFAARLGVKQSALGPMEFNVNGTVGQNPVPAHPPVGVAQPKNPLAQQPVPEVVPEAVPDYPLTATSPPYNGPTAEERAVLAELRAALKSAWAMRVAQFPPELAGSVPPMPEVRLPARRLTRYELEEMRASAKDLRGTK